MIKGNETRPYLSLSYFLLAYFSILICTNTNEKKTSKKMVFEHTHINQKNFLLDMNIGLIGAGNLGKAIIDGLCDEPDIEIRAGNLVSEEYQGVRFEPGANRDIASWADSIILAVKPSYMADVIAEIKEEAQGKNVISVAAGLSLAFYKEQGLADIIRIMPNIAIGKKAGTIGVCASKTCNEKHKKEAMTLLQKIAYCIELPEEHLDTIVALSGSGIAYLAHLIGVFIEEGRKAGLSKETATTIVLETMKGASALLATGEDASSICSRVATKGGITEQGLQSMREEGIDTIIKKVLAKTLYACKPSKE